LTDRTRARDYFAEYHAAIEAYRKAIEDAFGFAFGPEHDCRGKDAPPGSALRQTYDAMTEAERERDDRHPLGTWIG
jgi:hypothetical protein